MLFCSMLTKVSSFVEENFNEPVKESTWALSKLEKLFPLLSGIADSGAVLSYK